MAKKVKDKPNQGSQVVVSDVQKSLLKRLKNKKALLIGGVVVAILVAGFAGQQMIKRFMNHKKGSNVATI